MHYMNSSGSKANVDDGALLETAQATLSEGHRLLDSGDAAGALIQYEKCRASGEAMADDEMKKHVLGAATGSLGNAYYHLGRYDEAIKMHLQALEISREIGDRRGEGSDLGNLGLAYWSLGRYDEAIKMHLQALEISREIGDRRLSLIHI